MDRLNTNIPKWFVMVLILILTLCTLCCCSRKVTSHVERTSDTLIIHHSDTLQVYDTIKVISKMETTDSVTDNMVTYVVVDTTGRVLTKYVYRDRNVYHNKDALSASGHVTNRVQRINNTKYKAKAREAETKIEKPPTLLWWRIKALFSLVAVVLGILLYFSLYSKCK